MSSALFISVYKFNFVMENNKKNWVHLKSVEDFNKFIEENKIINPREFREKFKSGYNKASMLGLLGDLVYESKTFSWSHLNTVEDFNKFIKENDIKTPKDFVKRFGSAYVRASKLGALGELIYTGKRSYLADLNTPDDFNKFIEENDIKSHGDLARRFGEAYHRANKLGVLDELIYPKRKNDWSHLNTSDDFNKFIEENDIKGPKDFFRRFGGVYHKANKLGVLKDLKYKKD
jgi:hypothetical protein